MVKDSLRKSIIGITYDRRNLPTRMTKPLSVYNDYSYDDAGQRIYKQTSTSNKELYLRDHTGKELAVYDWVTGKLKMLNLYGNGIIGKVNVYYNAQGVRTDNRQYYFKDHLGSIRQTFDATASIVGAQDYYPYGEILRSYYTGGNLNDKYKFTEKERDTETNYDYFGAGYYDSDLARWLSVDPLADKYPGWSPYNYVKNDPLNRFDPNGKWDVKIRGYNDRGIHPYGIATVHDRNGNEVFRFTVRLSGKAGSDRMVEDSDTPTGVYDIPDKSPWISGKSRESYGPNHRLNMVGISGEIADSKREDIRIHGGRQEVYDSKTGTWIPVSNPGLVETHGCIRAYDADMVTFKQITDDLSKNDPEEVPGQVTITNDLEESLDNPEAKPAL